MAVWSLRLTLAIVVVALATPLGRAEDERPNILIILCDDVGWAEFGFQGNEQIPTPHIDSIAQQGVRFTQGYVSGPYCSPTRAGLVTGRYQTRFGHEFNSATWDGGLSLEETTIATRFHDAGYATCAVGKWHLGANPEFRPTARGFDEFYGTLSNTPFFHPKQFVDSRTAQEVQPKVEDPDFYTTDAYGERAVDWLDRNGDRPWMLYVPFNAQHAPLQAPEEYLDRFQHIENKKRRIFAAMMASMDDAVGEILKKVRDLGQEEKTLIFFLSDNGGPTGLTTSRNDPLRGFKATTWEGGVRVPFCVQWKGKLPEGVDYDKPVIQLNILPTALIAAGEAVDPAWKLDGVDLMPFLTGNNSNPPHETLYWRFGEQRAIRHGDWKLVVARGGSGEDELYNLASDVSESQNLANSEGEKVAELRELWQAWNQEQAPPADPPERPAKRKKLQRRQAKAASG